ncbi:hydroxymethylbilane synthase [Streptococcus catagoni]|uniref:hydroxymethylbilane synthase n=1 Tax=Streptococcus catagoni TaxID=2654874 RepID=UPI00140DC52B|nr:hydroxymethylbilane synthase [Streptococcus catagoni]
MTVIRVGTRQSKLALTQTQLVLDALKKCHPQLSFELIPYKTKGDRLVNVDLQKIGGKGVFVKDIEQALLDKEVDLAIHSLKDVPARLAENCIIAAVSEREDVRDCLIFREAHMTLDNLPENAIVGTSSIRRQVQIQKLRPDLICQPLRGNIDTRIKKLEDGQYDAIVLAMAGLKRMGWTEKGLLNIEPLDLDRCLPAISQGALAMECLSDNKDLLEILKSIHDPKTAEAVKIERQLLALMNADCTFPIAAYAQEKGSLYQLDAMLADKDNKCIYVRVEGEDQSCLADQALVLLKEKGAFEIPCQKK